ncbi:MAG: bifunctional 2-polyprenyl-6-hydroxyphenol methylase/3-demethylubiquinol 3-O-methyltransferase UbiG, partial [Bauldia litoralis]
HAQAVGLDIDYRAETAEALVAAGERFDIVLSLEVVEHVADVEGFVTACCALTKPGGLVVMATLNRTAKAFAMAIVGAEYVMRWLPRGTHDWRKFLRPSELAGSLTRGGAQVEEIAGITYNPLFDEWRVTGDVSVNYMIAAGMPAAA